MRALGVELGPRLWRFVLQLAVEVLSSLLLGCQLLKLLRRGQVFGALWARWM